MSIAPAPLRVVLIGFRPHYKSARGKTIGYASVSLPDLGLTIFDVKLMHRHGEVFAHMPERLKLNSDEVPVRDADDRLRYLPTIRFNDPDRYRIFAERVVAIVRDAHPEAFAHITDTELQVAE